MGAKVGRPALPAGERMIDGVRVPVLFRAADHEAFRVACDGRPMAGVLRTLAAEFVLRAAAYAADGRAAGAGGVR